MPCTASIFDAPAVRELVQVGRAVRTVTLACASRTGLDARTVLERRKGLQGATRRHAEGLALAGKAKADADGPAGDADVLACTGLFVEIPCWCRLSTGS
jgi:hypothetical protein